MRNPTDLSQPNEDKEPNWFQAAAISIADFSFGDIIFGIIMVIVFLGISIVGIILLVDAFINYPGITSLIFFPTVIIFGTIIGIWLYGKYLNS